MWTDTASIATSVPPHLLWRLLEDVAHWTSWNAGVARIALDGPVAGGSSAGTRPEVRPGAGVVDETARDGTRFLVSHELRAQPDGGTRVTYSIRVDGPDAATLGPLVTADIPDVLAALKAVAGE